ncbi:MAG TPA: hypothetical protein VFY93_15940 [Planctomycetota bacterium]|nr:hypothetical protein [Planctomycetota bacterium]
MRARVILILLGGIVAACGPSPKAGRNPKETVRNLEVALRHADIGAVYDMLSARGQRELAAPLVGFKAAIATVPDAQLKAAGLARFKKMEPREMLVAAVEKARDENPKALDPLKSLTIVVADVTQRDDRATVKATFLLRGRSRDQTLRLVREGGLWKLDGGEAVQGLPVPTAMAIPDCSGPAP